MNESIKLGDGYWAFKENALLAYNDENNNFKPIDLNSTRATTATRVNKLGLIESVNSGVPRVDYLNNPKGSLLVEPQRTNLLLRSEEFDNASWVKNRITETPNAITAPNGTLTADLLDTNANGSGSSVTQNITSVLGTRYNISVFVKRNNTDFLLFNIVNNAFTNGVRIWFNINTKTISSTSNVGLGLSVSNTLIEEYADDWLRLSTSVIADDSLIRAAFFITNANGAFSSIIGDKVYIWGAQLEAGSNATSYIPTVASTVTRNQDVISKTGISSLIGQTEGTVFVDVNITKNSISESQSLITLGNDLSNRITIFRDSSDLKLKSRRSSTTQSAQTSIETELAIPIGNYKCAFAYKNGDSAFFINGIQIGSAIETFTISSLSVLQLGVAFNFTAALNDSINLAQIFKTRLTNSELATLTTL